MSTRLVAKMIAAAWACPRPLPLVTSLPRGQYLFHLSPRPGQTLPRYHRRLALYISPSFYNTFSSMTSSETQIRNSYALSSTYESPSHWCCAVHRRFIRVQLQSARGHDYRKLFLLPGFPMPRGAFPVRSGIRTLPMNLDVLALGVCEIPLRSVVRSGTQGSYHSASNHLCPWFPWDRDFARTSGGGPRTRDAFGRLPHRRGNPTLNGELLRAPVTMSARHVILPLPSVLTLRPCSTRRLPGRG